MSCLSVSVSGGTLLYAFDLYEVDFSSLWTLMPDVPDTNFPLITFNNAVDGSVPVYGAQTGGNLESIYYPSFVNSMQLIEPNLEDYNAKILASTPSTLSYLVSGLQDVFSSTADITSEITYGIDLVISASQQPAVELERAWDEAWERCLINPNASVLISYFSLMGLTYEMDIRRSEGTNITSFNQWLDDQNVPEDIQANLQALDAQLTSGNSEEWETEYNYTNQGYEPYKITSVFFGIQNLKIDPNWSCDNPYELPEPWTRYKDFDRPRLDALRAYGRLIIPDKITKVRHGSHTISASSISGNGVITLEVPYGFDVTNFVQSPYGSAFSPSLYHAPTEPVQEYEEEIGDIIDAPYSLTSGDINGGFGPTILPGPSGFVYDTAEVVGEGDPNGYSVVGTTLTLPRGRSVISFYVKNTDCDAVNLHLFDTTFSDGSGAFALSVNLLGGSHIHRQSLINSADDTRVVYDSVTIEELEGGWKQILVYVTTTIEDENESTADFGGEIFLVSEQTSDWEVSAVPSVDGSYTADNYYSFTMAGSTIQVSSLFVYEIDLVPLPLEDPIIPPLERNWQIETIVESELWNFDNTHFGVQNAYDDYFTMTIRVPLELRRDLQNDPSLGSNLITINWIAKFIAPTEYIYPYMESMYFDSLYQSCDKPDGEKVKYVKGTGILFDVQSFASGNETIPNNLNNCKNDILAIYDNYFEYAGKFSKFASYGDILNIHGRYIDAHGSEFFATTKQVLRPQEYIVGDNQDVEIVNLNAIVIADEAKACADGQVYNADDLTVPCSETSNIFQTNQVPVQKSTTSVSLSSKLTKINGKICPVLPSKITPKN